MHEASIAQSIIQTVLAEAEKQNACRVESVEIEIGELTFLGVDQVEFWVKTGFEGTIAQNAHVIFKIIKAVLQCNACGYEGNMRMKEDPLHHMNLPTFSCPRCHDTRIEITRGKEAVIRRITIARQEQDPKQNTDRNNLKKS